MELSEKFIEELHEEVFRDTDLHIKCDGNKQFQFAFNNFLREIGVDTSLIYPISERGKSHKAIVANELNEALDRYGFYK